MLSAQIPNSSARMLGNTTQWNLKSVLRKRLAIITPANLQSWGNPLETVEGSFQCACISGTHYHWEPSVEHKWHSIHRNSTHQAIDEIPTNSAPAPDHFSSVILKNCKDFGDIPTLIKISNITPIHKRGGKQPAKNYWPVALTSHWIKIFGKVIWNHLVDFKELTTSTASGLDNHVWATTPTSWQKNKVIGGRPHM